MQRGERRDVAGHGIANRKRSKGFLTFSQTTRIFGSGGPPECQHPPHGPKVRSLESIPNGHVTRHAISFSNSKTPRSPPSEILVSPSTHRNSGNSPAGPS